MVRQPAGTVTFLFSDIERSTRLLGELGRQPYARVLGEHRRLLREAFERNGGYEVDCEGDAFFVAFQSAESAVQAAADAQSALAAHEWPQGCELRVRMGIHTGEALLKPPKYVGLDVHRAARVMAAGHGGQVLISQTTRELVGDEFVLRDLGDHRLKDLSELQRLYQLGEGEFPPLRTLYQTNLPVPATPFLGRERELREVRALLLRDDVRLLTLTGPGGTGKTRLALQSVADVAEAYPNGVYWVPLAPLRDPALLPETIAHALGAKEGLPEHVADRRVVIVLDNFEQLIDAAVEVAGLLAACPRLDFVVTSRERLQLAAEHEWPVPPLDRADAVALFIQRASALGVTVAKNGAVAELCARLDDLPLAVELAAARAKLFSPEQLLGRLGRRLDLLKGGRDADPRQQTLRATIEWSHALLDDAERSLFAHLAVFAGGCTLEAAEEVCDADADVLASLLDKSLIRGGTVDGERRYWMLETIREYAVERLNERKDASVAKQRHAAWVLELVRGAEQGLRAADSPQWLARLEREHLNIREALSWLSRSDRAGLRLELVGILWRFWAVRGHLREGLSHIEEALEFDATPDTRLRAFALRAGAELSWRNGDLASARRFGEEALQMFNELRDEPGAVRALNALGVAAFAASDFDRARTLWMECVGRARMIGDLRYVCTGTSNLGELAMHQGDYAAAAELTQESLALGEQLGDQQLEVVALFNLALASFRLGDDGQAADQTRGCLELSQTLGDVGTVSAGLVLVAAQAARWGRDHDAAVLVSAADALEPSAIKLGPNERTLRDETVERIHHRLSEREGAEARSRGSALNSSQALDLALRVISNWRREPAASAG